MNAQQRLAERFEQHCDRLRVVACRMLGSLTEADDVVQEAWLRLARADASRVENLGAWLASRAVRRRGGHHAVREEACSGLSRRPFWTSAANAAPPSACRVTAVIRLMSALSLGGRPASARRQAVSAA